MATAWPTTLPDDLVIANGGGALGDNTIRSKTDIGPAKVRRRSTAAPDTLVGSQLLTATQFGYMDTFYKTTLVGGTLPMTWKHPVSRAECDMRFLAPPAWQAQGGRYLVTYQLEILP